MISSGETILADIDATLDQLIKNAELLRGLSYYQAEETEVDALQKTQESLLSRLLHMEEMMLKKKKSPSQQAALHQTIRQKVSQFSRLNARLIKGVAHRFGVDKKRPRIGRNRKALKLSE